MKKLLLILSIYEGAANAQRVVYHTDLVPQAITNTAFKVGMHKLYVGKLDDVVNDRSKTVAAAATIEQVHQKIFNSLTNVDGAIKNGKTLYYIGRKIPQIFDNLSQAATLASGKPYLVTIAADQAQIITARVIKLQTYLQEFVIKSDANVLITPTDRDRFVYEVYQDISIIHSMSMAMVNSFKLYNLQDAINKVVPYQVYVNMDKTIVHDMAKKLKF